MAQIEIRDVRHVYNEGQEDETVAIENVSLSLEDGTANALLGPSGCGKTTLLQIISGLLTPTEGRILIDGNDVTDQTPAERDIAQVFQFPVIYSSMNVYDNLAFPLRNGGVPEADIEQRVHRVAELLELTGVLQQNPSQFGPELNQLLALGRGIIREDTSAILFDEPMTDVEPSRKLTIRRRVKEAQVEFGITALYVTHDQHEALTFAERVAIMRDGRLVQYDTGENLYQNPVNTFIGHFIGSPGMNLFDCTLGQDGQDGTAPHVQLGPHRVALPDDVRSRVDPGWTDCQLGIRPSAVALRSGEASSGKADSDGTRGDGALPAVVDQVEMLDGFRIVTATLDDTAIAVRARVAHDHAAAEGETVRLHFPKEQVRLFHEKQAVNGQAAANGQEAPPKAAA
jgi:glycerol transport system ATP-binding protein